METTWPSLDLVTMAFSVLEGAEAEVTVWGKNQEVICTAVSFPGLRLQVSIARGEGNRKDGGNGSDRTWRMDPL